MAGRMAAANDGGPTAGSPAAFEESSPITGQVLSIDGGMLVQSRPPGLELKPLAGPDQVDLSEDDPKP